MKNLKLQKLVDSYMKQVPMVHEHCDRCLRSERWHGNALLMLIDAAFDSIGLNYFQSVVPKVEQFRQKFILPGKIKTFEDLAIYDEDELRTIWKNRRSWQMAKNSASYFVRIKKRGGFDDKEAFIYWAKSADLKNWQTDPIGKIKGVGINTYQYLRMMGGIDTVMPDKIVKRVLNKILAEAKINLPASDIEFVLTIERLAPKVGYKAIELCWMTWLIQSEAGLSRTIKYAALLPEI